MAYTGPRRRAREAVALFGDEELDRAFKELPETVRKKAVRPAITKAAAELAKHAKRLAPKDTGALRRAIKSRTRKNAKGKALKTRVGRTVGLDRETLGARTFYAAQVELGSQHTPPRSFLRRALDEAGPALATQARAKMWAQMKIEAKKHYDKAAAKARAAKGTA